MKLIDWPKYSWCFPKESSVLSKRSVDSKQKNRRCYEKESTMLFKRIDDAKRKQSIYSQISLNCYVSGGNNTGPKHSRIIVFPLGFREAFSLLPSCLWIYSVQRKGWSVCCYAPIAAMYRKGYSIHSPPNFY